MIITQYGIAIADRLYHKEFGFGSNQPDLNRKYSGLRIVFDNGRIRLLPRESLYHYRIELIDYIPVFFSIWMLTGKPFFIREEAGKGI